MDILDLRYRTQKSAIDVYPGFKVNNHSKDLMTRANDFYAVWDEATGLWQKDEQVVIDTIDRAVREYADKVRDEEKEKAKIQDREAKPVRPMLLVDSESGMIDRWHKYVQKQLRANYKILNQKVFFANDTTSKEDYASFKLEYPIAEGNISAYEELMSTLYEPSERRKLEWAIGAVISGDSKEIQKFIVLYGKPGAGKGTFMKILAGLFKGYTTSFIAKDIVKDSNSFSLEPFKNDPLVAIQSDGDLSKIVDNSQLNTLISHEEMFIPVKHKDGYWANFNAFLFLSSNRPVQITESFSGLIRRLIDVYPSGKKIEHRKYKKLLADTEYEYGAIAYHCLKVYEELGFDFYDDYIPERMIKLTNPVYGFVDACLLELIQKDQFTLKELWKMYNDYVTEAKIKYPLKMTDFGAEIENYFKQFDKDIWLDGGKTHLRNVYSGFDKDKFANPHDDTKITEHKPDTWIVLEEQDSIFDSTHSDCVAQLATEDDKPTYSWDRVWTKLKDICTSSVHYTILPGNEIVIDFDIRDENGNKSLVKCIEEASKWPATYCEVSKGGQGLHLHYYYTGDVQLLSKMAGVNVEVKTASKNGDGFKLRRRLSLCNNLPIKEISGGLPLKETKSKMDYTYFENERHIRAIIARCIAKKHHGHTAPEVSYIKSILDTAYETCNFDYDLTDLKPRIISFALGSTNQSSACLSMVNEMHFQSKKIEGKTKDDFSSDGENAKNDDNDDKPIAFFDIEVFKNLLIVCWMTDDDDDNVHAMVNPQPWEVTQLTEGYRLIGFNNRKYDNHILYARMNGYGNYELYRVSKAIIDGDKNAFFAGAYNLSYTDIYDFCSTKQSLKKWEIELGINHVELNIPWDSVPDESLWETIVEYCKNDVRATRAVFHANHDDFVARLILADIAGMTPNTTTNTLTAKIIFGDDKHPDLIYTDLSTGRQYNSANEEIPHTEEELKFNRFPQYEWHFNPKTRKFENIFHGKNGDIDVGFGGRVVSFPGVYYHVALLDIESQHPSSAIDMNAFGKYTQRFADLKMIRIHIKHGRYEEAAKLFDGKLAPYLKDKAGAKKLSKALKIAINSVYGLTSAKFDNIFRDKRNDNNIVALRGALFMCILQEKVEEQGYKVIHIKTDSCKIPDADDYIIKFVQDLGKEWGYNFEHEATYEKICLINDAVYIAKDENFEGNVGYDENGVWRTPWTATGTQFAVPYVFKTLFSHEPVSFKDMCETKSVKTALYLDENEGLPDVSRLELQVDKNMQKISRIMKKYPVTEYSELPEDARKEINEIEEANDKLYSEIEKGHNYRFVGRVGQFTPVVDGVGGGYLMRKSDAGYSSVGGTKGYRWMESPVVKEKGLEDKVDTRYYQKLVDDAISAIDQYTDFYDFAM